MGFSDIFNSVIGYFTTAKQDVDFNASLNLFKQYLIGEKNPVIRMWVADAKGRGHQSSTVNLIYQITGAAAANGFEYNGLIQVYYRENAVEPVLRKLFDLLPSLNNQATGGMVNNAHVNLIEWRVGDLAPMPVVNLGFTAGVDQEDGIHDSPKLAARLNTIYFLRLEPYKWNTPEELQFLDAARKTIVLTDQPLLNKDAFKQRAYWEMIPVAEPDWAYYSANGLASQVAVLQSLIGRIDNYDLGVAYSIRTEGNYELQEPPEERMFQVIAGYLASQMNGAGIRAGAKPIVVLSMDRFSNTTKGSETTVEGLINGQQTAREKSWQMKLNTGDNGARKGDFDFKEYSLKELNQLRQSLKPGGYRAGYLADANAGTRVRYVWEATQANVEAQYEWLNGANNRVLFVQVGSVPAPMFNYLMDKAAMPSVFEGQNTGNLALQFGKPYFHVARPATGNMQYPTTLLGYAEFDVYEDYNNIYMPVVYVPTIVYKMQQIADLINSILSLWPAKASENPAEIIGTFIKEYASSPTGKYRTYYKSIKAFYQRPENDKFRIGASYLGYILQSDRVIALPRSLSADNTAMTLAGDGNPLTDLLKKLYDNLDNKNILDLFPGVYSAGPIFDFISGLLGIKVSLTDATITPAKDTEGPAEIIVTGNSNVLDSLPLAFIISFTAPEGSVLSEWKMTYTGDWLTNQLPWLLFKRPYVTFTVADTIMPSQGSVGGILQGLDLDLSIRLPIEQGLWQLEGHFEEPASVAKFFQLAGGVNLVQALPSPFNAFSAIGVTDCQLAYNSTTASIEYVSFVMSTSESVQLMQGLTMNSITFNVLVMDPGSLTDRVTTWSLQGKFTIGTGPDAGVIIAAMKYPGPFISGQLVSGVIRVTDLFNLFLPGTVFDPKGYSPEISEFLASFEGTTGNYNVTAKLNFDWSFEIIPGAPTITINNVGVSVESKDNELEGGISGGFTFGKGATAFSITLSADYSKAKGWVFSGEQTEGNTLELTALANQLLPSNWQIPAEYRYALKNLNFFFEETTKFYEIGGETDGFWTIPFINLNVRADMKFGFGIYKAASAGDTSNTLLFVNKRTIALAIDDDTMPGYYCTLNADIEWLGIKMKLFFDYNPDVLTFRFTWGILTGTIVEKEVVKGQPKQWIGTLKFTDSVTVGSIVEEAVSWATGYQYGLSSPWDLLNSLPLSALELEYNFTTKQVSFKLDIGEINLGFCKITKIGISYQSEQKEKKDNGVFIIIDGSFFWLIGQENLPEGQSPTQLKWDATDPKGTPSPSGQGNKYLDLRLLALGQHVTIPGFAKVNSVQEAIQAMKDLPPTEEGQIPDIIFDVNSSWLVGMDFGILKLKTDDKKESSMELEEGDEDGSGYFIDMQIVFNDPNLYGLRIALSGEPARIFKGLDFQILYRKISDSVGVYQAEIALPDIMRKIQLGVVNITLPVFAIEIYTNGDFLVDLGFPKNADFSRSFTLQMIIYVPIPIPIMGSAGIYFGKKSSATSTEVPKIDNGTFNPVIVFGVGLQFGLGYDFNAGILSAGFSLTFVTIIEGVIAKFNPYQPKDISTGEQADVAPAYYYSIKGVAGIQGKLYGYIDFKIIKAEVNLFLSVLVDLTITAYKPILIGITVRVTVSVSIKINLFIFTITISFSFDMTLRGSYEIKVGSGTPQWNVITDGQPESGRLLRSANTVLTSNRLRSQAFLTTVQDNFTDTPVWNNLTKATVKAPLTGYIGFGLSMAGDKANTVAEQQAVYSAMLFIQSVASAAEDQHSALLKATGAAADTSFEILSKQVFRWVIAAFHNGTISAADVDALSISQVRLQEIFDYLNDPDKTDPMPVPDIIDFLKNQVIMTVSKNGTAETNATYFPIIPDLSVSLPAFDNQIALDYAFASYNTLSATYIHELKEYFNQFAVQLDSEQDTGDLMKARVKVQNAAESMATFIFADYFLLLARQMVQNALDALSTFHYPIVAGQTVQQITGWINTHGQFGSGYVYTVSDLFENNKSHVLTPAAVIKVRMATYSTVSDDTFNSIPAKTIYNKGFAGKGLATVNAANTTILQNGISISYTGEDDIIIQAGNSLNSLAKDFGVNLDQLLDNAKVQGNSILDSKGLLMPSSKLMLPDFNGQTQPADTLITFSARYGVTVDTLATTPENAAIVNLFDSADNDGQLIISDLPQFEVGELIKEIQGNKGLQQLSGMASRYYLSGLRLPTDGITPNFQGMWVTKDNDKKLIYEEDNAGLFALTGQQFPIPVLKPDTSYAILFTLPTPLSWIAFEGNVNTAEMPLVQKSDAYTQVQAVRNYAQQNVLDLAIEQLGAGDMFSGNYGHYSFSTVGLWQAGSPILLPYSGVINSAQTLSIWTLPNDLLGLAVPNGRAITPRFRVQIGTVDPATQSIKSQPVTNYGWGTQVTFTIKRVPLSADSSVSRDTYEISGADGNNALILEQMVTYLNNNDSLVYLMAFGFTPNQSSGSNPGIQTDPISSLTIGIAQANLSTFTRPDNEAMKLFTETLKVQSDESNLLNNPSALVTLLWQASITRDGGYYLYYYNTENGEGLPDHAFNDKGEAVLSLITLYSMPANSNEQNLLQPCMNMFVTGDPVNVNDSTLYAQADPLSQKATFKSDDTLTGIAFNYFANIGDVAEDNATAVLTAALTIAVPEGTYQVKTAGGETLQSIADKFGTTVLAIKDANKVVTNWPDPLPFYFSLRLPSLTAKAGSNVNTGTLLAISAFYGMDITALANYNSNTVGLFAAGTQLTMTGGPVTRVATVPAGVVSLEAIRKEPAAIPPKPTDPNYALLFLQHNFSILSFKLINNSWFETKEPFLSLPAGPTESKPDPNNAYLGVEDLSDKWIFKQSVPYYKFANQPAKLVAGMPDISTSPYKGIGYLVQADFMWLDIYGNTILTTLSQPSAGNIINESPILTGYTDALLGVNQWPSVSTVWQVAGGSQPAIQVPLSFDTTQYNGLLTAKAVNSTTISLTFTEALDATTAAVITNYKLSPDLKIVSAVLKDAKTVELTVAAMAEDMKYTLGIGNIQNSAKTVTFNGQATFSFPDAAVAASSSIVQQATHDFQVYEQIWYQLTDPNGISMSMQTSLFDHDFPVDSSVFDDLVNKWISSIYLYLQDRSQGGITVAAPANTYTLKFNINPTGVNPAQIFEVVLSLSIARTGGAVMGDFETTGSVKQVTTLLSPSTDAPVNTSRSLDVFADAFEEAMSVTGQYYLKICTGADRDKSGQQKPDGTIWATRLGIDDAQPIAYSVVSPGEPDLFAPQPVSNKLESRTGVNIYTYSTGTGIDFNKPAYQKDFTEIDMDKWVSSFFGSMDNILTPEFTASIQLIDKKLNTSYLKDIQNSKESLADIAKMLMVTVFENETADARPVQEALKQALLAKLSNLYATNSGILFDVKVKADPATGIAPNLYGSLLQNTVLEGAVSDDEHLRTVTLHFSATLDKTTATDINNYTLTSPLTVQFAVLSTDGRSVILTASADVSINFTTVITGEAILDANNRPVRGDKKATVSTNYISYAKSDQLTITAAKIKLDKSTDQSLAFLLSTPEIVRGQDGEVLSKINLNLSYCGTNIEHQVAVPVNGFTPSSWLSFVLPNVRVPLESQLGGFPVPMFLRSFPQNPSLVNQSGTAPDANNPDISKLLNWDYSFHYSESFYYPQDILNFTVNFNVGGAGLLVPKALTDAFSQLAEFITVYPSVDVDIKALVTQIDAKKYYDSQSTKLFTDAGIAMKSFTEMVRRIVDAASGANGLILNSMPHTFASMGSAAPYSFEVREAPRGLNGKQVQVVTIHGQPPAGVGTPKVLIEPGTYKEMLWTSTDDPCGEGNICYYYVNRETGEPLLSKEAQSIQSRQLVLPELNILQRQDALTTVYLTRNEDLIHDKKTNPAFVYTTGNLSFSNPYLPTITSLQEIEIADLPANNKIPTTRSLFDQLKTLMDTLLKENTEPTLSFQATCSYDYAINTNLLPVNLPVFMQTMVPVTVATQLDPMLQRWAGNINQWFSNNNPNRVEGALRFDLVIFSNLTQQPYPLLRLPGLVLSLEYILPAPGLA